MFGERDEKGLTKMALDARIKELGRTLLDAAQEIKGKDIVGLDLSDVESYTDFILIASGGSDRQTKAVADNIIKRMFEKHHRHPLGIEGYAQAEWILIDFGEVIAHVFFDEARKLYHLEDMWLNVAPIAENALTKLLSARVPRKTPARATAARKAAVSVKKAALRKARKS